MNIARTAFETYRKYLGSKLAVSFAFTIFVLASLAIGMVGSYLFLVLMPLVILPVFVCFQLANSALAKGMPLTQANFFGFYRVAFSPSLSGSYQIISSFLKSFLVYLGISLLTIFILTEIYSYLDSSFYAEVQSISALIYSGNLTEAVDAFDENATIAFISSMGFLSGGGAATLIFLHLVGRNSISPHLAFAMPALPGRTANMIHRRGIKTFRLEFNLDYYGATWLGIPLIILGYLGGVFATYFFVSDVYLILLAGIAGSFLLLTPFLPYYLDVIEELFKKYRSRYFQVSIDQARKAYEDINTSQVMSEEEKKELGDLIDQLKRQNEPEGEQDTNGDDEDDNK